MPLIYRVMTVDDDKPSVANNARGLGVRAGDGPHDDIPVGANGEVTPGTGGMSVAPSWRDLPDIRIPRRLREKGPLFARGKDFDACWRLGEGAFVVGSVADGLVLRPDRPDHGTVEPKAVESLNQYLNDLAATRELWVIDES
jgi:hypothetical protein